MPEPGMGADNDHGGGGDRDGVDTGGLGPGGAGGVSSYGGDRGYGDNDFGGFGSNDHGGTGGMTAAEFNSFMAGIAGTPSLPPGTVEIPGPPVPGDRVAYAPDPATAEPADTGDLFNDFFDPGKFSGPLDPDNAAAVKSASAGLLTANRGLFGFREKLVDDPDSPHGVKAEIQFDPVGAVADFAETAIGLLLGGPVGFVAGTAAGRLAQLAADPSYTADQALYDATNPFGVRDTFRDPTSPIPDLSQIGRPTVSTGGYEADSRGGDHGYTRIPGTSAARGGVFSAARAPEAVGATETPPTGETVRDGAVIDIAAGPGETSQPGAAVIGAPATSPIPEMIVAGALALELLT